MARKMCDIRNVLLRVVINRYEPGYLEYVLAQLTCCDRRNTRYHNVMLTRVLDGKWFAHDIPYLYDILCASHALIWRVYCAFDSRIALMLLQEAITRDKIIWDESTECGAVGGHVAKFNTFVNPSTIIVTTAKMEVNGVEIAAGNYELSLITALLIGARKVHPLLIMNIANKITNGPDDEARLLNIARETFTRAIMFNCKTSAIYEMITCIWNVARTVRDRRDERDERGRVCAKKYALPFYKKYLQIRIARHSVSCRATDCIDDMFARL